MRTFELWPALRSLLVVFALQAMLADAMAQPQASREHEAYLRTLEAQAEAAGPKGSSKYSAVLREGLAKLAASVAENRQPTPRSRFDRMARTPTPKAFAPTPSISSSGVVAGPLDEDPRVQKAVREQLKAFRTTPTPKMMIGQPTDEGGEDRFKHAVAVWRSLSEICSGVLVGRGAVLTAAHCVCLLRLDQPGARVTFGVDVDSPTSFPVMPPARRIGSTSCSGPQPGWDVALVFFAAGAARLPDPAPVAAPELLFQQRTLFVTGFGATEHHTVGHKLGAEIPIVSPICGDAFDDRYGCVPGREAVLLDSVAGRDSCKGDSGGPAYLFDGRYRLVAVTSRGLPGGDGAPCDGRGGVYTLIGPDVVRWMVAEMIARGH